MKSHYLVKDKNSGTLLKEFDFSDASSAYQFAKEMDEMGIEVEIISPTITQTLAETLGVDEKGIEDMENSIQQELEDHDFSCCVSKEKSENSH